MFRLRNAQNVHEVPQPLQFFALNDALDSARICEPPLKSFGSERIGFQVFKPGWRLLNSLIEHDRTRILTGLIVELCFLTFNTFLSLRLLYQRKKMDKSSMGFIKWSFDGFLIKQLPPAQDQTKAIRVCRAKTHRRARPGSTDLRPCTAWVKAKPFCYCCCSSVDLFGFEL